MVPHLLNLCTSGEWPGERSASLTRGKKPSRYPLDRRLGGPQSRSGRGGKEETLPLLLQGIEPL
jgi:hypothetical protein